LLLFLNVQRNPNFPTRHYFVEAGCCAVSSVTSEAACALDLEPCQLTW